MTNTEVIFRYLARTGPSLRASIAAGTHLDSRQVSNALENLTIAGMVCRDGGRLWRTASGKVWSDHPRAMSRAKPKPPEPSKNSPTMAREGYDFGPLYQAMGMP